MKLCVVISPIKIMQTLTLIIRKHFSVARIFNHQNPQIRVSLFREVIENGNNCQKPQRNYQIQALEHLTFLNGKQLANYFKDLKKRITPEQYHSQRIVHALAHTEFNAFTAYADTYFRFGQQFNQVSEITAFRKQIGQVAADEGRHFLLLYDRLQQLGINYGFHPVVSYLTQSILQTKHDLSARIALISILNEGKGISAVKRLISNLQSTAKDHKSVKILQVIQSQQTGHYQTGLKWFKRLCQLRKLTVDQQLQRINKQYRVNISLLSTVQSS